MNYLLKFFSLLLFFFICKPIAAKEKYWIYFNQKPYDSKTSYVSSTAINNRMHLSLQPLQISDAPVNTAFVDYLKANLGVEVINRSKWLNAISAELDAQQIYAVSKLTFVNKIEKVTEGIVLAKLNYVEDNLRPLAMQQMHAEEFSKLGLTGKGVTIGVIDGRFNNVNNSASLKRIVEGKQILGMKNFATLQDQAFLEKEKTSKERHCPEVLKLIGGFNEENGAPVGLSPDANFYLARTEISERELKVEEDYWISGLEWLDSLGVRLVNSSIGYSIGFEKYSDNHRLQELDGQSTAISKAAQIAANEKGMVLVIAAGNEGDDVFWRMLSVPGDAQGVITVGAVDEKGLKQNYSSIGPKTIPYVKPDVVVFSAAGTSFAAPVITGMIGCIMQKEPSLKSADILDILHKAGQLYPYGNNYVGFGVPDARRIIKLLNHPGNSTSHSLKSVKGSNFDYRLPKNISKVIVFEKSDKINVVRQASSTGNDDHHLILERKTDVSETTIVAGDEVTEVVWN